MKKSKLIFRKNRKSILRGVFLLVVFFMVVFINRPAQAREEVSYFSEIRSSLMEPVDVDISDTGDIYVLDKKLAQVFVFDNKGKIQLVFGEKGSDAGKMYKPESLALTLDERILVADTGNSRVNVFKPNGQFDYVIGSKGTNPGEFIMPNCVVINPSGYIFVADKKNKTLSKFTPKGVFLNQYDLGQEPDDILFDRQNFLYVLFAQEGKIVKYDSLMKVNEEITLVKDSKDFVQNTTRIAVDHRGDIYLVEAGDKRIIKMTKNRKIVLSFGSGGSGRGQFNHPLGIATDEDDNIYIADSNNKRVQIFQLTGIEKEEIPIPMYHPPAIEYDDSIVAGPKIIDIDYMPDDGLYAVTEFDQGLIYRGKKKDVLRKFDPDNVKLRKPKGLYVLDNGKIIVADTGNNQLQFIQSNGLEEYKFGVKGRDISQFNGLEGVAVNQQGYIYVADTKNNRIQIFNKDGIYMSSFGEQSVKSSLKAAPGTFLNPKDLVFSSTNELYVLDYGNKRIQVFDPQGKYLREIGGPIDNVEFINPVDIAMDEKDYLYVADRGRHAVIILDPQGKELMSFGSAGQGPSYFPFLTSVDSSSGKIYVSDYYNDDVKIFSFLSAMPSEDDYVFFTRTSQPLNMDQATEDIRKAMARKLTLAAVKEDFVGKLGVPEDVFDAGVTLESENVLNNGQLRITFKIPKKIIPEGFKVVGMK